MSKKSHKYKNRWRKILERINSGDDSAWQKLQERIDAKAADGNELVALVISARHPAHRERAWNLGVDRGLFSRKHFLEIIKDISSRSMIKERAASGFLSGCHGVLTSRELYCIRDAFPRNHYLQMEALRQIRCLPSRSKERRSFRPLGW